MTHRSIHWFRKGLRLHDNPALLTTFENSSNVWPIFILDPWFTKNAQVGVNRWRFLLQSLEDLDKNLKKLNSRLFVIRGNPNEVLQQLFKEWKVTRLTFEVDTEPYAKQRDIEVEELAKKYNVEVVKCVSHTLYDVQRTIEKNGGKPPLTYQRLQTLLSKMGPPPKPVQTIDSSVMMDLQQRNILSHLMKGKLHVDILHHQGQKCLTKTGQNIHTYRHTDGRESYSRTTISEDHDKKYGVPSLADLGKLHEDCGPLLFPGGETEGLSRLERMLKKTNWICTFEKPKTEPNSLTPSTTVLSPYIKFGCLSVRTFYYRLLEVYSQNKKHTQPPVSLHGQLLWREFFYTAGAGTPNFDRMEGNPICIQIPWEKNDEHLNAWANGQTGYPFIDAVMTQLKREGWIHHLARHAVACFLTRGDLWISWEEGQKVFEEHLLDADWSINAGNWMWLSASSFFYQYFRVYSPINFGKKTDKNGDYIRKYLPILSKFPAKYIYEPWTAPHDIQAKAGCIIGKDYPSPILDHDKMRQINMKRMAEAYGKRFDSSQDITNGGQPKKKQSEESDETPDKKVKKSSNKMMTDFLM